MRSARRHRTWPRLALAKAASLVAGLTLLTATLESASAQAGPNLAQGDGRVSEFYTWSGTPPTAPGQLLRSEKLPTTLGLAQAADAVRILYSSTDGIDGKSLTTVSGALFLPKGSAPPGGWPLIAWAHGTVGLADICAPSWAGRSYRDVLYLNTWLGEGYAVVATDYQGLGTPGPHPYLAARAEAYGVLDSARAVLKGIPGLADRIVIVGQSQGAGAAFATAGFAPRYAPDLDIRGTVATGTPYLAAKTLARPSTTPADKVDRTIGYLLYIGLLLQQLDPSLEGSTLFTDKALPVFEQARIACIGGLESDVVTAGLTRANSLKADFARLVGQHLGTLVYPTLKLAQPIFIGTGEQDGDVDPAMQLDLVKDACAAGSTVEAHLYAGLTHSDTVNASLKDSLPFVRKVMQGEAVAPVCAPQAE